MFSGMSGPRGSLPAVLVLGCFIFSCSVCADAFTGRIDVASSGGPVQSVSDVEKNLKDVALQAIGSLDFQAILQVVSLTVSPACENAIHRSFRGAMEMQDWAVKMIDATGKLPAGILEGTATSLGDYDECLDIQLPIKSDASAKLEDFFRGQYCMIKVDIPHTLREAAMDYQTGNRSNSYIANTTTFLRNLVKIGPRADIADMRLGICVPSACKVDDLVATAARFLGNQNKMDKMMNILRCETKEDYELRVEQIAILSVLGAIAVLVVAGTLVDTILRTMASGPVDDVFFKKQNTYIQFLVSFSVGNNFRKLTKLEMEDGQLSCVRGIKFLTVCLVIVVFTYAMPIDLHFLKYRSSFNIYKFMDQWLFSIIANSSVGIDTLFFLAGLQITYRMWEKSAEHNQNKVSVNIIRFLIVWYSRLTASQLLVIALFLLFPLVGSGPLWADVVIPEVEHCKSNWWMNILYINNFWPANETCLFHTWFVTALMQMLVITPFILWILNRWSVFGVVLIMSLILGSCVAIAMVTIVNQLPPAPSIYFISFLNLRWIWDKMFMQAYNHVAPFCIGILMGYVLAQKPNIEARKITVVLGWGAAVACNLSILFGLYSYRNEDSMEVTLAAFYAAAHRFAWAAGIAWIVFACAYGYGGAVNDFLSWRVFIPFERLSNLIYLLHPLVIFFHTGQVRERMHMGHLEQVVYSSGYIFLTCLLAALCYVVFIVPYRFLELMAWRSDGESDGGRQNNSVSKVIAIKERITNDFNTTMRETPGHLLRNNRLGGNDNSAFTA